MLTVTGIAALVEDPEVNRLTRGGAYFNFDVYVPDKREVGKRHTHKVNLYVPDKSIDEAEAKLKKAVVILLHSASWNVNEKAYEDRVSYFHSIKAAWQDISVLGWFKNQK